MTLRKLAASPTPALAALVLGAFGAPSLGACASSEARPSSASSASDGERASDRRLSSAVAPAADVNRSEPPNKPTPPPEAPKQPTPAPEAPKPLTEETKKIIEEYKALALKNDCSRGFNKLEGQWRFVGETRTPDYSNTLKVTGTRFKEVMSGKPDGKHLEAEIDGEIRCVFKNRVLVQVDKVVPEGAYGNKSGDIYPCDLLSDMDPKVDRMLMICYFDWDLRTAAGLEYEWERVEVKP